MKRLLLTLPMCLATGLTYAQTPLIDGVITPEDGYGTPLFVQNTNTGFGNNDDPDSRFAGGSEMDAIFAKVTDGKLFLMITGNLESNFNKWEIFVDSVPGGLNTIGPHAAGEPDSLPEVDFFGNALQNQAGLTFDTGFEADFYLSFTNGNETASNDAQGWVGSVNYAELKPISENPVAGLLGGVKTSGQAPFLDQNSADPDADPLDQWFIDRGAENTIGLEFGVDNSNVDGVPGGSVIVIPGFDPILDEIISTPEQMADAEAVTTGFEFAIPLSALGDPADMSELKITTFINGVNHDFVSNQVSGGILGGNLGSNGEGEFVPPEENPGLTGVDFSTIDDDQFVSVLVDNPGGGVLVGDLNGDGFVGAGDLDILLGVWNQSVSGDVADLNEDGFIGAGDLDILLGNWNAGTPPTGSAGVVPEPASIALLGLGAAAVLRRRR